MRQSIKSKQTVEIEDSILAITQKEAGRIEMPIKRKGGKMLIAICALLVAVFWARLLFLDVVKGSYYKEVAKENRIRQYVIKAPRGRIFDKKGIPLVENVPSIDLTIIPYDLPKDEAGKSKMIANLSNILGTNDAGIQVFLDSLDKTTNKPQLLKPNLSQDEALALTEKQNELPGVKLEKTAIRNYLDGAIFAHLIGYDGKITREELKANTDYLLTDTIGKTGLEKSYEKYLRGIHGAELIEVDSLGETKKQLGTVPPETGSDIYLNIDAGLQKKIFDSLSGILEKNESKMAAAVAIDPRNGSILALASLPSFDNNLFPKGISAGDYSNLINDPLVPLFNRAISGEYPPGSTIKPTLACAALEEKIVDKNTSLNCPGSISVGSFTFRDWKTHGTTDIRKAIAESCDVFFYSVGGGWGNISGLGMDRMKKYETAFGFGSALGIDLPGEAPGLVPDEKWKEETFNERWYIGNSYHAAIGQGYLRATPLQIVNSIATIANGGTVFKPRIVNKIKKDGEEFEIKPEALNDNFISQETIRTVQEGMRQTVESGTAQTLKNLPVQAAGKTGTAQFGTENKTHAWFVSYAPYENPEIAMIILVEGGGEGHSSALPVTKEVYEWYFGQQN